MEFPYEKDNKERIPLEHYLEEYRKIDPGEAASRCGVEYDEEKQQFHIRLMGYPYLADYPEFALHPEQGEEGYAIQRWLRRRLSCCVFSFPASR